MTLDRSDQDFDATRSPDDSLVGRRLGPYVIQSLLGAGGMGHVYRARDAKLGRDVAIKVLPNIFTGNPERLARFEREARMLAALNHPNIAAIYGFEHTGDLQGLVLELVEGETLAARLRTGALPLAQVLVIARQIADALDAAHERGIIHRDLKPANVILQSGRDVTVKVLDFGLAKVADPDDSQVDQGNSPTVTVGGTRDGIILGTAAYMSPEQSRGKPLDTRTDVWSFGCVLYEMLTGRMAFGADTTSDTIAAILGREPDWSALPPATPPAVRRLIERCLEKDAAKRPRDIGDIRNEIDNAIAEGPARAGNGMESGFSRATRRLPPWSLVPIALVLVLVGIGAVIWALRPHVPAPSAAAPGALDSPVQLTDFYDAAVAPAISPDGRWLTFIRGSAVFFGQSAPRGDIYVKMLAGDEAPLQLTRDGSQKEQPVFSPDGSRIIFTSVTNGFKWDSWEAGVLGQSAPRPFLPNVSGLVWLNEHQILYAEITSGVHMKIATSLADRTEHRDIYVPRLHGGMAHRTARSPDGKSLLVVEMDGSGWLPCRLMPFDGSSAGNPVGPLDGQCVTAAWSPDGRWMYFTSNSGGAFHLWRQQYPSGAPEQITFAPTEQEGTAVTADGRHIITSQGLQQAAIWLHDEKGDRQLTTDGFAMLPTMLPSSDRLFYLMKSGPQKTYISGELWSLNVSTGEKDRLLPGVIMSGYSITRDGQRVVYTSSGIASGDGVWVASLDRQSRTPPRPLTHGGEFRAFAAGSGEIVYMSQGDVRHLYRMKEDGSDVRMISQEEVVYLISVSPDGRWAAASMPQDPNADGSKTVLFSTSGDKPYFACDECVVGFGPARFQSQMIGWGMDGKSIVIALKMYGYQTQRSVILPYDSRTPLDVLWPKGLKSEADVLANPGAQLVNEGNVFPASRAGTYLAWRQTTQSNLWRIPIPR